MTRRCAGCSCSRYRPSSTWSPTWSRSRSATHRHSPSRRPARRSSPTRGSSTSSPTASSPWRWQPRSSPNSPTPPDDRTPRSSRQTFLRGLRTTGVLMLPTSALLIALATPLVSLYRVGAFRASDVPLVVGALRWWASGLIFYASTMFLLRTFYSLKDTQHTDASSTSCSRSSRSACTSCSPPASARGPDSASTACPSPTSCSSR